MPTVQPGGEAGVTRGGRGRRVSTALAEINVVPLVDVMLVLLIIFMVTAPMIQRGVDVKLPEFDVDKALDQLAGLERDDKLSSRDIIIVDLRLPDRVTVQLSDAAALARDDAAKKKQQKTKGGAT